jgi:hypothetical protein
VALGLAEAGEEAAGRRLLRGEPLDNVVDVARGY